MALYISFYNQSRSDVTIRMIRNYGNTFTDPITLPNEHTIVLESGLYHRWEVRQNGAVLLRFKSFNDNINYIIPSSKAIYNASASNSGSVWIKNAL